MKKLQLCVIYYFLIIYNFITTMLIYVYYTLILYIFFHQTKFFTANCRNLYTT